MSEAALFNETMASATSVSLPLNISKPNRENKAMMEPKVDSLLSAISNSYGYYHFKFRTKGKSQLSVPTKEIEIDWLTNKTQGDQSDDSSYKFGRSKSVSRSPSNPITSPVNSHRVVKLNEPSIFALDDE
jgi:hypothetical protein